ncbi:MAG: putative toxin-antitoxin system toxin component, PIN family [Schwartzia sp.]|nr:putative toxin-antitoxin system toxin component, PIN family [Schwartzia sp. (in: firmicutes)]MBR1759792.1 putative toxin-antitoxin system toxin component, PIN family [Schwartzia sp. (in: firmicutes)]
MRVLLDTNILISAAIFPSPVTKDFLWQLRALNAKIFLCNHIVKEFVDVYQEKFPHKQVAAQRFLKELPYHMIPASELQTNDSVSSIRDVNDAPILTAAIKGNVDILVTGDKDFLVLDLPKPKIMTMAEFIATYDS